MKIKKNHFYIGVLAVVIILSAAAFYFVKSINEAKKIEEKPQNDWLVDSNGYLSYPLERGDVKFSRQDYGADGSLTIHKIIYQSRGGNIYGFLVLPTSAEKLLPGVVLLPGAGVSKESELELAKKIASLDAAVLVIDQRGVGETTANANSIERDYIDFFNGKEPSQHLMVYDALRAYDLMETAPFTDSGRIMMAGESLGGRIAVIAAAIDRNIGGVLVISSAGLGVEMTNNTKVNSFLNSIDSDHYIELITPRKIVMMHNANDKNILLGAALESYSKAQEPKQFVLVNDTACNHGYCDSMYNGLVDALDYLVGIKSKTLVSVPSGS
ncbi:acetylxylan esterase [Candidatus Woesearchaeota archaeon]|nr:acetylxylan esterase [Candidatus Woesearchaeota archaeon]